MDDDQFAAYWQENSSKEKSSSRAFMFGLSSGFAIGVAVLIVLYSGWYTRATMEANSKLSAIVLFLAILIISVFIALMYRRFKWEMQEQRFLEIVARKNKKKEQQMQP